MRNIFKSLLSPPTEVLRSAEPIMVQTSDSAMFIFNSDHPPGNPHGVAIEYFTGGQTSPIPTSPRRDLPVDRRPTYIDATQGRIVRGEGLWSEEPLFPEGDVL